MANVQIHELNDHTGALGSGDYLATDDGTHTTKIPVTALTTLVITQASFSSLPLTITNTGITSDMVVVNAVLGTPSAQTGDWTVTTADGSLTIAGTISGSTTLTLYLTNSR